VVVVEATSPTRRMEMRIAFVFYYYKSLRLTAI